MRQQVLVRLFDVLVVPVLHYCSECWGYLLAPKMEKLHLKFLKDTYNLKKATPSSMVYLVTGRVPLAVMQKFNIIRYWYRTIKNKNDKLVIRHGSSLCYYCGCLHVSE